MAYCFRKAAPKLSIKAARKFKVPTALRSSIPCTGGSQVQNLNSARFGFTAKLRGHWKEYHALWATFKTLATAVHTTGGLAAIEWPLRCRYWRDAKGEAPPGRAFPATSGLLGTGLALYGPGGLS